MKHPQTFAETMYKHFPCEKLKAIKDYACCAFTLLWWLGIDGTDWDAIFTVSNLMDSGALDKECTVYWAKCVFQLTGRTVEDVEKVQISSIKKLKEPAIVRFTRGGVGHWVGVKNGKVVFNSLEHSRCVEEGKPTEMRVLKIKGIK